jgi:hypothetical protein
MIIAYNPAGSTLKQGAPSSNDIIFDLNSLDIWAKGSKIVGNTVTSNLKGLVPGYGTAASGTIDDQADNWVLAKSNNSVGWYKLPVNAFNNAVYNIMTGATSTTAGTSGLVPAPAANKHNAFLRGDGTWVVPTDSHYTTHLYIGANGTAAKG